MANVSYSRFDLGYPPWALDFDPYNRGYLLVGGGGGEGQKEVPNRLTLLDVSQRSKIEKLADLDIANDSPVSLGVLAAKDGLYAFSGINSGAADRKAGKNEHLRSFKVDYPMKTKAGKSTAGKIVPIGQAALFSSSYVKSDDAFQRLLRLSPAIKRPSGNKRIGAIASSLSEKSEIVIFDATNASPSSRDVIHRLEPIKNAEANDIDLIELSEGEFRLVYCIQNEVYVTDISYDFSAHKLRSPVQEPVRLNQAAFPGGSANKSGRPKYRSIRFLTPEYVLILANLGSISEFLIIRHYPKGGPGDVVLRKRLPKRMGAAVSLDVSALDADPVTGARQIVVAVAAQAHDVSIFTIDYVGKGSPTCFESFTNLRDTHIAPMKKVALTPFHSPYPTAAPPNEKQALTRKALPKPADQYLRLASISLSNTLVIDDLPLYPVPTKSSNPRYVLNRSGRISKAISSGTNYFVFAFVLLVSLILVQSVLDARAAEGQVASFQIFPPSIRSFVSRAREDSDPIKEIIHEVADPSTEPGRRLRDLFHLHHNQEAPAARKKAIIVRHSEAEGSGAQLSTDVHSSPEEVIKDENTKRWKDLTKEEQETWKERLIHAGEWAADEGETVLKSIFFSEVAGAVGRAAVEAIGG
jgi:hypothetical protein